MSCDWKVLTTFGRTEDRLPLNVRLDTVQAPAPKLKHDDMLDEVKNYLINALRMLSRLHNRRFHPLAQ